MAIDLYQTVTDSIIAKLEQGVAPWVRPWNTSAVHGGMPYNATSGKPYRGINVALLFAPQFAATGWLTFKQARDVGANVRKGEKGSLIVFYKPFVVADRNATPDADGKRPDKTIPLLRSFHVFNVEQIDNLPERLAPKLDERSEAERTEASIALMQRANVRHGGDRAFYAPGPDFIQLPEPTAFRSRSDYQATALHELTHWTGHESRLARAYGKRFGDEAYAREELVAEMGAAFLCAHCGIAGTLQHPAYIDNWLEVLKGDKRAVLIAASHAQKAADYVIAADSDVDEVALAA